jgi:hypothetical protein
MVETITNLPQKKMEVFLGDSTVRIEPMFRITPEAFNAVNMLTTLRPATIFSNDNMVTSNRQGGIGLPVIRIVQTSRPGVSSNQPEQLFLTASLDRKGPDQAVTLQQAKDDDFTGSTPTSFTLPVPTKHGLVTFDGPLKRFSAMFFKVATSTDQTIKPFNGWSRSHASKSHPVNGNSQGKKFDQSSLGPVGKATAIPYRFYSKPGRATATFQATVSKFSGTTKLTFGTTYHA